MENSFRITRRQTNFLRACIACPNGIPIEEFPSPVVLRRWMRRATFRRAVKSIRDTLRFAQDLHLAAASTAGARELNKTMSGGLPDLKQPVTRSEQIQSLTKLLRLSHAREQFTKDYEPAEPAPPRTMEAAKRQEFMEFLRRYNPLQSVLMPLSDLERRERLENEQREKEAAKRRAA